MIVNAVSELPAIIVNNIYELSNEIDNNNKSADLISDSRQSLIKDKNKNENNISKNNDNQINYNELATKLKNMLKDTDLAIEFSMDKELNKMIMKLIDEQKDEVVQQFPPEIAIKIARIVASTLGSGQVTDARI